MAKELKCEFQKEIDNEKVCKAFKVNRYGDIICQEEDCQLCKLKAENERLRDNIKSHSEQEAFILLCINFWDLINDASTVELLGEEIGGNINE